MVFYLYSTCPEFLWGQSLTLYGAGSCYAPILSNFLVLDLLLLFEFFLKSVFVRWKIGSYDSLLVARLLWQCDCCISYQLINISNTGIYVFL